MKTTFLKSTLLSFGFILGLSGIAKAEGKVEPSCSDDVKVACRTEDPEILKFRKNQIRALYEGLKFPGPIEVMKNPKIANHLFQEGYVRGRVTPLGTFTNFDGVVEYFYALAANPQTVVFDINIVSVIADEDQASVNVNLAFCKRTEVQTCAETMTPYEKKKETLTETGYFVFNKENRIIYFDLIIPNLDASKDVSSKVEKAASIAGICAFLTVGHVDPITGEQVKGGTCTKYFDNKEDFGDLAAFVAVNGAPFLNCVAFMSSIPFGSYSRANSNTFTCRQTHTLLTPLRPDYHCPHTAYDGGGKCVDFPYESYYDSIEATHDQHGH